MAWHFVIPWSNLIVFCLLASVIDISEICCISKYEMKFDGVQIKNELEAEKVFLQGNDKNGRPVVVILAAKHDANKRKFDEFKRKIPFVLIYLTQNLNIIIGFPFATSHWCVQCICMEIASLVYFT